MNTRYRYHLLSGTALLLAAVVVYGCSDFLDEAGTPQGTLDQGTLATKAGVEGNLIAAYRMLDCNSTVGAWGCAASNWVWGSVTSDDAYKGSEASDQPPINDIEGYNWGTAGSESYLNEKWRTVYEGAVRANATLRLLQQVRDSSPTEITDAEADAIRGEAVFLRAHYHFEAWRMWGSIPYYREDDTDFKKTNAGVNAGAEILTDLDEAISLLPDEPRDVGRASQWTAKAYKGRVQVYTGDYAGAIITLNDVRANGPYALEASMEQVWTGMEQYANGPETILAFQASVNDGEASGWNSNWGERLNFPHSGSYFGCCGFHQPSQNLVNFYATDANGLPLALTDPNWNANNANFVGGTVTPVDPRLDWTVGRDNVPYKDYGVHKPDWIRSASYGGPYSPKKHIHEKVSGNESTVGWVPTQTNGVNIHIFRYADVLLLLAEAMVEQNDLAGARTIVNQIRTRAAASAQGCGSADSTVTNRYPACAGDTRLAEPLVGGPIYTLVQPWGVYRIGLYTAAFASQAEARTAVQYERRLELAMEGQRFFDLRRWGTAEAVLNGYLNGVGGGNEKSRRSYLTGAAAFAAKHRWYPLPQIQIELSKVAGESRLTQNTGW